MKVLFAASECVPFIKTGGLADVVGALPPILRQRGVDVRVILPLYSAIGEEWKSQMKTECEFEVELGWRHQYCGIKSLEYRGVMFYFVDNLYYFGRNYIYGMGGDEYERYGYFSRAVIDAMAHLDFQPDIVHCHDWQVGMVCALLKIQYQHLPFYSRMKTIFSIHNLQYQGVFGIKDVQDTLGLGDDLFTSDKLECYGCANYLKAGLVYADEITTVSPSYAEEIQTAYYGERLDGLLRARRGQLSGILNGIDVEEYNPENDPLIYTPYGAKTLEAKGKNKEALQRELGLNVDGGIPIVALITRLSHQKGLDLVDAVLHELMDTGIQMVVLGMGDARYTDLFSWAETAYPGRLVARFAMDHQLAHRIYAGADMFLMPSLFEPCGLSQMIALRYGTVPIVRETGGLRDTVLSYNEYTGEGNGFSFFNYNAHDMLHTVERAVNIYYNDKDLWSTLRTRGMTGDYSWDNSAGKYIGLYERVLLQVKDMEMPTAEPKKAPRKRASTPKKDAEKESAPKKAPAKTAAKKEASKAPAEKKAPAPRKTTAKSAEKAADAPQKDAEKSSVTKRSPKAAQEAPKRGAAKK